MELKKQVVARWGDGSISRTDITEWHEPLPNIGQSLQGADAILLDVVDPANPKDAQAVALAEILEMLDDKSGRWAEALDRWITIAGKAAAAQSYRETKASLAE